MTTPHSTIIDFPAARPRRGTLRGIWRGTWRGTWRGMMLAENITHFVRTLRRAGMAVGPAAVLDCVEASREIDLGNRDEFYHALASCLVKRPEDRMLFDQAFHIFWRNPRLLEKMRDLLLPTLAREGEGEEVPATARRVDEALRPEAPLPCSETEESERVEIDMSMTSSVDEHFRSLDFQQMSAAEIAEADRAIDAMRLPLPYRPARRFQVDRSRGRLSFRQTLRRMTRTGGLALPCYETPRRRPRPLVVICDISGSMERYSRMLLRFTHALTKRRGIVHSFLFGTRLTNISRQMQGRDPDVALRNVSSLVDDWSGGTRISSAIASFNRDWSRRVLGQGAVVLLITDGLDRDSDGNLAFEIERLHKSCAQLIWLNPLLRFDGFEPRSASIQQILPHVDAFVPAHSLSSIDDLAGLLGVDLPANWHHRDLDGWRDRLRAVQAEA